MRCRLRWPLYLLGDFCKQHNRRVKSGFVGQRKPRVHRKYNSRVYRTFTEKVLIPTSQNGKPISMEHVVGYSRVSYLSSNRVINQTGL